MTEQDIRNEGLYLATMKIARSFLEKGLISEEDYCQFDTKMQARYSPIYGDLFPRKSLTSGPF